MTARTMVAIARERQLDWLLGEVFGHAAVRARARPARMRPWLAAALLALGLAAAFGTAWLRDEPPKTPAQEPADPIEWHQCHGPAALDTVPADVVNLRCFDFRDDTIGRLRAFRNLQRLDLSGMDINAQGHSVSLRITDAGLVPLRELTSLRWLSLAQCHEVHGDGLRALEGLPLLEHLDLTFTGVRSAAVERLSRLPSLRSLSLSYCTDFHGRSLAEVAKLPGLRRLELRGCTTLAAADVLPLARLTELRHLDLRGCQGRYLGQRGMVLDDVTNEVEAPEPPPLEDGIGVTDAAIAALAHLPLQVLLLGGCTSLTDAIAGPLAAMRSLHTLDLGELPRVTGRLLRSVPPGVVALALDGNRQLEASALMRVRALPQLRELGLSGLANLTDATLAELLDGMHLHTLRVGGVAGERDAIGPGGAVGPALTPAAATTLARQRSLRHLDLQFSGWLDADACTQLASLPELEQLDLGRTNLNDTTLAALATSRSLRSLQLTYCKSITADGLNAVRVLPLQELDLYATQVPLDESALEWARSLRGCRIRTSEGKVFSVP